MALAWKTPLCHQPWAPSGRKLSVSPPDLLPPAVKKKCPALTRGVKKAVRSFKVILEHFR